MKYILSLSALLLTLIFPFAIPSTLQPIHISGQVTDADDQSPLPGVNVLVKGSRQGVVTDMEGRYQLTVNNEQAVLVFSFIGYMAKEIPVKKQRVINVALSADMQSLSEVVVTAYGVSNRKVRKSKTLTGAAATVVYTPEESENFNTESYQTIHDNAFQEATSNPLSTFSIDVDAASYSNIRRFINQGQLPPKDAVRIEEMVNYFRYDYPQPQDNAPFSVYTEMAVCPWNTRHQLVHIGLQGKEIPTDNLPPANLVFLIDVSGSMDYPNKLPLLKSAFRLLVNQLRPQDRVAMVVYAGAAGMVLPSTPGSQKEKILEALDALEAGGSTAGGEGLRLAYAIAREHFQEEGNNRVILATDGDFNIGESSDAAMERLIEQQRKSNIFLTVLGFGTGNYKDSKMETLANKGNGHYAYIDNIQEARKVLVAEFGGSLFTIAKDVKLQLEFNPAKVKAYRLIGYENRKLQHEDFHNDEKDAGELGSGHTVTAMYEIIPAASTEEEGLLHPVDTLKYQQQQLHPPAYQTEEVLTLKLRYKEPKQHKSQLLTQPLKQQVAELNKTSDNFRFAAAVAGFGMLLRDSEFKGDLTYEQVIALARDARGDDLENYRLEFIRMVEACNLMAGK